MSQVRTNIGGMDSDDFTEDTPVFVRYPLTGEQHDGDREQWPWLAGVILARVGPDEWHVWADAPTAAECVVALYPRRRLTAVPR